MKELKLCTGINRFKKEKPVEGIIFCDNTCPHCGNKLELITKKLFKENILIRYQCNRCDYICPIKYEIINTECNKDKCDSPNIKPLYDKSIYNFFNEFGD